MSQYYGADIYEVTPKASEVQFMEKLGNTDAELKKSIAYIKKPVCGIWRHLGNLCKFSIPT